MTALSTHGALKRELERHIGAHADIVANDLIASGVVIDADALFSDLRTPVSSGSENASLIQAAEEGIHRRLRWQSLHWGTERVHPDAWPHVAAAACEGVELHIRAALSKREP